MTTVDESRSAQPARLARRLSGLRRLLRRFVRVKRSGMRLNLVFGAASSVLPATLRGAQARRRAMVGDGLPEPSDADLARMRADLADMLNFDPRTRSVFPSLVLVERGLARSKGRGLDRLPGAVLMDASALLARLAGDWSADGLCLLRARLKLLLRAEQAGPDDTAIGSGSPQVEEGSLSMFMELDREWEQQLHLLPPAAPRDAGTGSVRDSS